MNSFLKRLNFFTYFYNIFQIFFKKEFKGWGRKKTGRFAAWCYRSFGGTLILQEDGFIRSIGLGIDGSPSFSIVEDDLGIYYDASTPSALEKILNEYDFARDEKLMHDAKEAIEFIKKHNISKYNYAPDIDSNYFLDNEKRVLIIAQSAGDSSLKYGRGYEYSTDDIIKAAIQENKDSRIYLKIHPDVLTGKKLSDIDISNISQDIKIITDDVNPISLLKHFSKVYVKTSGMGFESLLVGCECVCFGMPFYAGWGITDDRLKCERRERKLKVEEVFAGAYILYTKYCNPDDKKVSNIFNTLQVIVSKRGR